MLEYLQIIRTTLDILSSIFGAKKYLESDRQFFDTVVRPLNDSINLILVDYLHIINDVRIKIAGAVTIKDVLSVASELRNRRIALLPLRRHVAYTAQMVKGTEKLRLFHIYF